MTINFQVCNFLYEAHHRDVGARYELKVWC